MMRRKHVPFAPQIAHRRANANPNNLPGSLVKKGKGWKSPVGLVAKLFIYFYSQQQAGDDAFLLVTSESWSRDFGVGSRGIEAMLDQRIPVCREEYNASGAKKPENFHNNAHNRLFHMYRERLPGGGYKRKVTIEHPLRSESFWPVAEFADWAWENNIVVTRKAILAAWKD